MYIITRNCILYNCYTGFYLKIFVIVLDFVDNSLLLHFLVSSRVNLIDEIATVIITFKLIAALRQNRIISPEMKMASTLRTPQHVFVTAIKMIIESV